MIAPTMLSDYTNKVNQHIKINYDFKCQQHSTFLELSYIHHYYSLYNYIKMFKNPTKNTKKIFMMQENFFQQLKTKLCFMKILLLKKT
jgi:hypothetical protein